MEGRKVFGVGGGIVARMYIIRRATGDKGDGPAENAVVAASGQTR